MLTFNSMKWVVKNAIFILMVLCDSNKYLHDFSGSWT